MKKVSTSETICEPSDKHTFISCTGNSMNTGGTSHLLQRLSGFRAACKGDLPDHYPNSGKESSLSAMNQKGMKSDRYKTELCRQFGENGTCRYGDKCQFAHGVSELRSIARHPKYKTNLCRTFHSSGFCPYGARCHFIHSEIRSIQSASEPLCSTNGLSFDRTNSFDPLRMNPMSSKIENAAFTPDLEELIRGFSGLLVGQSCLSSSDRQYPDLMSSHRPVNFPAPCSTSPEDKWPFINTHDFFGSADASPTLSFTESPTPSPTSMIMTNADIWSSLASIIRPGM